MCFEYDYGITGQILNSMGKQQCAEEIPEDYGVTDRGPCLLPKGHEGDHLSFMKYDDDCSFWKIDLEESLGSKSISKEKTVLELEKEWEGNVPQEILDLFKEDEDEDENENDEEEDEQ